MAEEFHISSLVVQGKPGAIPDIAAAIGQMPGAEVHGVNERGKMVVTLETTCEQDILRRIDDINLIEGVIMAALVYHQFEEFGSDE